MDPVDLADVLARWERGELGAVATAADVAEVRSDLESVARDAATTAGDLSWNPIRLSKRRIPDLLACERHLIATVDDRADGEHVHLGVLVDALAEHHVVSTRARLEPEPLELAVELCRARGDDATVAWVDALALDARRTFAERLDEKRTTLLRSWPAFDPAWWARTQERVEVGLADGEVVLSGRADVTVGGPPTSWPVLVIEVKSGSFSIEQRDDGLVYALLLALRDGTAPAAAVTELEQVVEHGKTPLWTGPREPGPSETDVPGSHRASRCLAPIAGAEVRVLTATGRPGGGASVTPPELRSTVAEGTAIGKGQPAQRGKGRLGGGREAVPAPSTEDEG